MKSVPVNILITYYAYFLFRYTGGVLFVGTLELVEELACCVDVAGCVSEGLL